MLWLAAVGKADADPNHSLNTKGDLWVLSFLVPVCILFITGTCFVFSIGMLLNTVLFCLMLVFALVNRNQRKAAI